MYASLAINSEGDLSAFAYVVMGIWQSFLCFLLFCFMVSLLDIVDSDCLKGSMKFINCDLPLVGSANLFIINE